MADNNNNDGRQGISILGIYVSDTAYLAKRMPENGETIMGSGFSLGPGGKGSNQAVAAGRAGAEVTFISKLGDDPFGKMALDTYAGAGVTPRVETMADMPTGAAFIFVNDETGENAIIVYPGSGGTIDTAYVEAHRDAIEASRVFVTQLEQPPEAALAALRIARDAGVATVFNPAPAGPFDPAVYGLTDYFVPNESEAAAIVGFVIDGEDAAKRAGALLLERGVGTALITLGGEGVYIHNAEVSLRIPAVADGTVIDTAGAGDAFVGGFAAALAEGRGLEDAARFGCATAGVAVTRRGTAPAMPARAEIEALLSRYGAD